MGGFISRQINLISTLEILIPPSSKKIKEIEDLHTLIDLSENSDKITQIILYQECQRTFKLQLIGGFFILRKKVQSQKMMEKVDFEQNLIKVTEALKLQYLPGDMDARENAQAYLMEEVSREYFWDILSSIVKDPKHDFQLKKSAIIFIEKQVDLRIKDGFYNQLSGVSMTKDMQISLFSRMMEVYLELLVNPSVELRLKHLMPKVFTIISGELSTIETGQDLEKNCQFFLEVFTTKVNSLNFQEPSSLSNLYGLLMAIRGFVEGLIHIGDKDLNHLYEFLVGLFPKISHLSQMAKSLGQILSYETIKSYYEIILAYFEVVDEEDLSCQILILLKEEKMNEILKMSFSFGNEENSLSQDSVVMIHDDKALQKYFNSVRLVGIKSVLKMQRCFINSQDDNGQFDVEKVMEGSSKFQLLTDIYKSIVISFVKLSDAGVDTFFNCISDEHSQELVSEYLLYIERVSKMKNFWGLASECSKELYFKVLVPLLYTTQIEFQDMEENPVDYLNFVTDLVDYKKSEVPKTQAAKLMYSLCENIDGMDSLIFRFSIESIQLYFENKETEMLKQTQQIKIFSEFKKENLMDIAFMSLSIIAPRIQYKRTDLETELTLVVGAHIDEIISLSNHLLMQRALLFLEVIGFELFQTVKGSQNLIKILEFYYSVITSQNVPPVLTLKALECIKKVFEDDLNESTKAVVNCLKPKVTNLINSVMNSQVQELKSDDVFDLFLTMIPLFSGSLQQGDDPILGKMVSYFIHTFQEFAISDPNDAICFKCLELLKMIVKDSSSITILKNQVETLLEPIFLNIENFRIFRNELVDIYSVLIENQDQITEQHSKIFELCLQKGLIISNASNVTLIDLQFLNTFFSKSSSLWKSDSDVIKQVIQKLCPEDSVISINHTCLLITIIEHLNHALTIETLAPILKMSYIEDETVQPTDYMRHISLICLAGFVFTPNLTVETLKNLGMLDRMLKLLITLRSQYNTEIENKLYSGGFINLISTDQNEPAILNRVMIIIKSVMSQLDGFVIHQKIKNAKDYKNDQKMRKGSDYDLLGDDMDDNDFFDGEYNNFSNSELKGNLKLMTTKLKNMDEFLIFRDFIKKIKTVNSTMLQTIISKFSESETEQFKDVLRVHRIRISGPAGLRETFEARKIYKVKRVTGV